MHLSEFVKIEGKKTIITDSVSNTNKLFRQMVRADKGCIYAVSSITIQQLAQELVLSYFATYEPDKVFKVIDYNVQSMRLHIMLKNKSYEFLDEDAKDISTAEEILRVINEIRFGKVTDEYINNSDTKLNEIKTIITDYEAMLSANNELDKCMLIEKALSILKNIKTAKLLGYMIPELNGIVTGKLFFSEITELEKKFIRELERVSAMEIKNISFDECPAKDRTNSFFKSYGVSNEVAHVVNEIINKEMRYGDVAIMYPAEGYERELMGALDLCGIPYSFPKGFRAANTDFIGLILDILNFAEGDFEYKRLEKVVHNPVLCIKGRVNSFERLIREGIGYGKDRYITFFHHYTSYVEAHSEDKIATEEVREFVDFLKEIIECFDEKNSPVTIYSSLIKCVLNHTDTRDLYRNCMDERLKSYSSVFSLETNNNVNDVIVEIRNYLVNLKCSVSDHGGSVVILPYGVTAVVDRTNLFVLGLSNENIATTSAESPVLSDSELRKYVEGNVKLALDSNKRRREVFELSLRLSSVSNVYFSYSYYDTVSLLDNSPALLYLDMLGDKEMAEVENITYRVDNMPCKMKAVEIPATDEDDHDKKNEWKSYFSASSLQTLIGCPLRFYYEKVKHIKSIDFTERNAYSWLNPAEKGNVFHHVMDEYVNQAIINGNSMKLDVELFESIFTSEIERAVRENPYPSMVIMDKEKEEEREILKAYLAELYDELNMSTVGKKVIGCEIKFNDIKYIIGESSDDYVYFEGSVDRMDGYIKDKRLYLQIYDYKTGKYDNKVKEIEENKQIQHHVYALAMLEWANDNKAKLENYFGKEFSDVVIDEIAYIFPFEEENRMLYVDDITINPQLGVRLPKTVDEVLQKTVGNASNGNEKEALENAEKIACEYLEEDPNICRYCNYKDICRL